MEQALFAIDPTSGGKKDAGAATRGTESQNTATSATTTKNNNNNKLGAVAFADPVTLTDKSSFSSSAAAPPTKRMTTATAPRSSMSRASSSWDGRSSQKGNAKPDALQTSKSVLYGRVIFVGVLVVAAAGLGFGAYHLMSEAETRAAEDRFDSVATRALSIAQLVLQEKKKATDSLALMMGSSHPRADEGWPMVYMEGYEQIASSLGIVTEGSLSFCPLVTPGGDEQAAFEDFAYDLFYNVQGYPNTTGVSDFGRGVFSYGAGEHGNETWDDSRFHITSGWTYHYSPREVLLPFIQSDAGAHSALMLNVHFEHNRAAAIDTVMTCSEERAASLDYDRECGSITDLMWSETSADVDPGPAGLFMVPIYPREDNTTLTGFIVGKQIWHDLLKHGFESDVDGVDVVLRTANHMHTYRIEGGEAIYKGEGEGHYDPDASFQSVGTHINPQYFSNTTVEYYMDLYSTNEFVEAYSTNNPVTACIGAVLIIIGTSLLFFCYDYFVRREFQDKKKLLEAKRQFVRFVSHEVRTPLNTVCMGLTLMQDDFANVLNRNGKSESQDYNGIKEENAASTTSTLGKISVERVQDWMNISNQVFQNADAAVNVLSDLLNYDKIQMGTLNLELSLIPIFDALHKTVAEFKIAACENKVNLTLDLSPLLESSSDDNGDDKTDITNNKELRLCKVVGDSVRLSQVFRNLISNGLKFSKEDGNLTIRVSERSKRKRKEEIFQLQRDETASLIHRSTICIDVIDEGVGMTSEQVGTVFDDGTQFNANQFQSGGGSGLGLSIAKGIVEQHGGKLTSSSLGLGQGSTFSLTLPLYEATEEDDIALSQVSQKNNHRSSVSKERDSDFVIPKMHILVVDDSIPNRKLCIRLLERNGHTCDGAGDGKEALEMVRKSLQQGEEGCQPYDSILLDYEMPIMDGPESCKEMRKLGCSAYIAGVTGNVMSDDVDHFRECGANCVLPKPFRLASLEDQWVEDGVTPNNQEGDGMVRVESGTNLVGLDDDLARTLKPQDDC